MCNNFNLKKKNVAADMEKIFPKIKTKSLMDGVRMIRKKINGFKEINTNIVVFGIMRNVFMNAREN